MRTKLDGWKRKGRLPAAAMKLKKLGVRGFLALAVALLTVATVLRMHMRDVSASLGTVHHPNLHDFLTYSPRASIFKSQ